MAHGLGHGIGLEVHDAPHGQATFEVGNVFTIEPGVYVSTKLLEMLPDTPKNRAMIAKVRKAVERYQNTGVRIEDDYLITPSGVEWLSKAPREVDEIEKLRLVSESESRVASRRSLTKRRLTRAAAAVKVQVPPGASVRAAGKGAWDPAV